MSFRAFLLKLVGQHPDQLAEQERFEENMGELEERRKQLDSLVEEIRSVRDTAEDKSAALQKTATSMRPPHARQESEGPGESPVSTEEPTPA